MAASLTLSNGDLKRIRFLLEEFPGMEQKAVNILVNYYETNRQTPKNQMVRNRVLYRKLFAKSNDKVNDKIIVFIAVFSEID